MSEAKADSSDGPRTQHAKHLRPSDATELVVIPAAQLYELIQRAVSESRAGGPGSLLVDKQDMARHLGVSPAHIDHLRKKGMPWIAVGQMVRFEPAKVLAWLQESGAD